MPGISASRLIFLTASKDMLQHRDEKIEYLETKNISVKSRGCPGRIFMEVFCLYIR